MNEPEGDEVPRRALESRGGAFGRRIATADAPSAGPAAARRPGTDSRIRLRSGGGYCAQVTAATDVRRRAAISPTLSEAGEASGVNAPPPRKAPMASASISG